MTDPIDPNRPAMPSDHEPTAPPEITPASAYEPQFPPPGYVPPPDVPAYPPQYEPQYQPYPAQYPPQYPPQYAPQYPPQYPPQYLPSDPLSYLDTAPPPPAPPQRRRARWPWVFVGAGAAAAIAVVVVIATSGSTNSSAPPSAVGTPPAAIGAYQRVTGAEVNRAIDAIRSFGSASPASSFFNVATIAAYGKDSGDVVEILVVMAPRSAAPAGADSEVTSAMLSEVSPNRTSYPTGALGGSVQCAETTFGTVSEDLCAWTGKTTGMMVSPFARVSESAMAQLVLTLRAQIER